MWSTLKAKWTATCLNAWSRRWNTCCATPSIMASKAAENAWLRASPEMGHITLSLSHEGGDIVIEMSDDGAGVDFEAVRRKAIKRGLISPDAELSEHDTLQFILQAGFSTAETITQISGRGVGMDVVHAEVKDLGGSMVIDSKSGQGARFRIRLPFSVSVNRALMVQCGEEQYAVPLNSIEGIVRVMPGELETYYRPRHRRAISMASAVMNCVIWASCSITASRPKLSGQTSRCQCCWFMCMING
jgi:chemotaxis protein histidine kinase CheA